MNMKTSVQLEISYDQLLSLVRKMPKREKIKLSRELEKDLIDSKLTKLLKSFNTKELNLSDIDKEVEEVRQEIY